MNWKIKKMLSLYRFYMRKSELDQYCNYEGMVTKNDISGALFSIHPDAIPSKQGDGNVAKRK